MKRISTVIILLIVLFRTNANAKVVYTVNAAGLVTPVAAATTTITYTNGALMSTLVMTVLTIPTLAPTTGGGGPAVCAGSTITLSHPTPGGLWSSSDTTIATVSNTGFVTGIAPGLATIKVTAIGANGCTSSRTHNIMVYAGPTPITGASSVCTGNTIHLSSTPGNGIWSGGNSAIASLSVTGVVTGLAPGTVTIQYRAFNGYCSASVTKDITVNPVPTPVISVLGTALMTGAAAAYSWALNGAAIPGATAQSFTPVVSGIYTVTVTDTAGCSGTSNPYVTALGVDAATTVPGRVLLYPNPAGNVVHIRSPEPGRVVLAMPDGRVILQQDAAPELSVSSIPAGIYIVTIRGAKGDILLREKLIKLAP